MRGRIWRGARRRARLAGAVATIAACTLGVMGTVLAGGASASCGGFENPCSNETAQQFGYKSVQREDTPNDPNYDQSEPDSKQHTASNFYAERFDLFGFPSELTPNATYAVGPNAGKPMVAGFNASGAWKTERGRSDVVVAILDDGIDWGDRGLRLQIHLNTGELPYPEHSNGTSCGTYDCNGDGVVNVEDYAEDPRVSLSYAGRQGPGGLITAQDLIHAFGNCQIDSSTHLIVKCVAGQHFDNDGNGYANDIAGWNFFDNNNESADLSSYFAAHHHGTGRAADVAERGNNGEGSIGVCPHCQVMPMKVWDTFVTDANTFALGMVYATDNGAKILEGANGSLYHSAFAEAASQYAYEHGALQTYSGDDLNTGNHNYAANYPHAMLIQGTVPDTVGLGQESKQWVEGEKLCGATGQPLCLGSNVPVGTFFRGANTTQFGGKSSISMEGPTGSVNTSKAAGAAGLVVSAGLDHGIVLRPDETRELLEQTAERVLEGNTAGAGVPDPAANPSLPADEQWTSHFGWGRANVGAAVGAVNSGDIPPEAAINAPDWYAPLTGTSMDVTGLARARFATGGQFHWKLMWGAGQVPASWTTVHEGDSNGTVTDFGSIDLEAVREALATHVVPPDAGGPTFAAGVANPFQHEFTVQLEVNGQGIQLTGIDRRVFNTFTDPTLRPGYPKRLGTGGESPTRYVDLTGNNVQELVVPTEDGVIHAYKPDGTEAKGWPVHTALEQAGLGHTGSPALAALGLPREPPRGPLIGDLAGDGRADVIVAAGIHVYAWQGNGQPVPGFPVSSNPAFCGPALETNTSHPKCGFLAAPAIAHLEGFNKGPDIVEPSLDGHLYAWRADGTAVPGYPIALIDPKEVAEGKQLVAESINEPAIGDLGNQGHDDVVVASNEVYGATEVGGELSFAGITSGAAGSSGRLYAIDGPTAKIMPGWPVKMPGIIQNVLPLIGPGQDAAIAKIGGETLVVASVTGGALEELNVKGEVVRTLQQAGSQAYGAASNATDKSGAINLFESASVGDLLGTGTPAVVKYELSLGQAANLLLVGQNFPYNHLIGAWEGSTGTPLPAYPTVTDDYQFLSASNIAKIDPALPTNQIVAGTGLGLLHAYDGATGLDVTGFPKVTGGWLSAPASLSVDGRVADMTREGYLFEWQTKAPACQPEWPTFRHDQQGSGNYNHDGTPPDAPEKLTLTALGKHKYRLAFTAPGDNGPCGTPASYRTRVNGEQTDLHLQPGAGGSSFSAEITLSRQARALSIQAIDAAGNIGQAASVAVPKSGTSEQEGTEEFNAPLPTLGRCVKVHGGPGSAYEGRFCVHIKVAKKANGQWLPGPGAKKKFSAKSGAVVFESEGKKAITCSAAALEGEYTGPSTEVAKLLLTGCKYVATNQKCESSPLAEGTIEASASLTGELGFITVPTSPAVPTVGWDLKGLSMTFTCANPPETSITTGTIQGSAIAPVTPVNMMAEQMTLTYSMASGKQLPEMFEGAEADTLTMKLRTGLEETVEPSGLSANLTVRNEESLEVKAQTCQTYVGCKP
jgi:subtilase family protein